jgi:nicotinate phosphoribosyltransferase
MSFPSELEAFRAFARIYPDRSILLVDTYDTIQSGVPNAITVFKEMFAAGLNPRPAIRLDSGDLAKLSKIAHRMIVAAGFDDPLIVASNDLEEDLIADIKRQGAKINAWGVGTHLITARNNPSLNGVYKLVAIKDGDRWTPRIKLSQSVDKATVPGRKQLVRYFDKDDNAIGDVQYWFDENVPQSGSIPCRFRTQLHRETHLAGAVRAEPLLETVFHNGHRTGPNLSADLVRDRALDQMRRFPDEYKRLRNPEIFRVHLSPSLGKLTESLLENPDAAFSAAAS